MGLMDKLKKFLMETETKDDNLFKNNQDKISNEPIFDEKKEEGSEEPAYEFNNDRELLARKIELIKKVIEGIPAFEGMEWDQRDDIDAYESQNLNETFGARLEDTGYISISVMDDEVEVMFSYGPDCKDQSTLEDGLNGIELPENVYIETYPATDDGSSGVAFYIHNNPDVNPLHDADDAFANAVRQFIGLGFKALQAVPAAKLFGI